jgi:hypothetical protein
MKSNRSSFMGPRIQRTIGKISTPLEQILFGQLQRV